MLNTRLITHLLFLLLLSLVALNVHLSVVGCHEAERETLLKFKQSLTYDNNSLSSWEGKDCCNWEGVGCDNVTAYVNRLDLHNPYYHPYAYPRPQFLIAQKLDPSLVELRHLNYLDLSCNDFQGSQIPVFIGSFKHLRYLNLSHSNFSGVVPSQLGNLTKLKILDLSSDPNYLLSLTSDLHWVSNLASLQYLNMGGINISPSRNFVHLTMPPSLTGLWLSYCELGFPELFSIFSNSTWLSRIQHLDLSGNYLDEHFLPRVFANMTSLTYLDLSGNELNGSIPFFIRNMRKLEYLDLHNNLFSGIEGGAVMGILGSLCKLKSFDLSHNYHMGGMIGANHSFSKCVTYDLEKLLLSYNNITGTLPSSLGDFKYLRLLDIRDNSIDGPIPSSIGNLLFLEELSLSNNRLYGQIPTTIGNLSFLEDLFLSNNNLYGTIPESLGKCNVLSYIDLSLNFLQGVMSEPHLTNLSKLVSLDLSFNHIGLNLSSIWSPPFQLSELRMTSCKIQSSFPQWIDEQTSLYELDLSDNLMSGKLPQRFQSTQLTEINISHNQIIGPVPYFSSSRVISIDLSYNLISGSLLPDNSYAKNDTIGVQLCQLPNLMFLDLQRNKIISTIPDCLGYSKSIVYINLAYNNLFGNIPISVGLLPNLKFLKLSNNSLQGPIPPTLSTSLHLEILDLGGNNLIGKIPINRTGNNYPSLKMLRLRGNQLAGGIPSKLCYLDKLKFIDLGHNNFSGRIPRCLGNLFAMRSQTPPILSTSRMSFLHRCTSNVSCGRFIDSASYTDPRDDSTTVILKGAELEYTTTLEFVVDLDLSSNALVGSIPEEITNLSALIGLDLSNNHLTGYLPKRIGEMRSLQSLDLSNNNLSGTIPSSISALTFLSYLNLSYNHLHGQIPTGTQLQTFNDPSAYKDNLGLCGDPLPNKCKNDRGENPQKEEQERDNDDIWEKPLFYFVIFSGFATGFWGVVGSLLLKRRFRWTLFQLVGNISDYFYVQVMIRFNRLRN